MEHRFLYRGRHVVQVTHPHSQIHRVKRAIRHIFLVLSEMPCMYCTVLVCRMPHRKWREIKSSTQEQSQAINPAIAFFPSISFGESCARTRYPFISPCMHA